MHTTSNKYANANAHYNSYWYENDYEHAAIIGDIIGKKQADHCQ